MCSFQLDPDARASTCSHLIQTTVTMQQSQKSAPMSLVVAEIETVDVHHLHDNDIQRGSLPHSSFLYFCPITKSKRGAEP